MLAKRSLDFGQTPVSKKPSLQPIFEIQNDGRYPDFVFAQLLRVYSMVKQDIVFDVLRTLANTHVRPFVPIFIDDHIAVFCEFWRRSIRNDSVAGQLCIESFLRDQLIPTRFFTEFAQVAAQYRRSDLLERFLFAGGLASVVQDPQVFPLRTQKVIAMCLFRDQRSEETSFISVLPHDIFGSIKPFFT